ncbi:hypothetical protein MRX96_034242 [Rhipicephalus microplus]
MRRRRHSSLSESSSSYGQLSLRALRVRISSRLRCLGKTKEYGKNYVHDVDGAKWCVGQPARIDESPRTFLAGLRPLSLSHIVAL